MCAEILVPKSLGLEILIMTGASLLKEHWKVKLL